MASITTEIYINRCKQPSHSVKFTTYAIDLFWGIVDAAARPGCCKSDWLTELSGVGFMALSGRFRDGDMLGFDETRR